MYFDISLLQFEEDFVKSITLRVIFTAAHDHPEGTKYMKLVLITWNIYDDLTLSPVTRCPCLVLSRSGRLHAIILRKFPGPCTETVTRAARALL